MNAKVEAYLLAQAGLWFAPALAGASAGRQVGLWFAFKGSWSCFPVSVGLR